MALAGPFVATIFGHAYAQVPFDVALLAINYIFVAFGLYSTNSLINSQDQASIKIVLALVTVAMGGPLGVITISRYGVLGMLITLIFDGVPSIIIGLVFIKKRYNLTIDWWSSGKIILCSTAAAFLSYFVIKIPLPSIIQLIIGITIFLTAFIGTLTVTRTLNRQDIINLRTMTSSLGPLAKILNKLLNLLEKLTTIFSTD